MRASRLGELSRCPQTAELRLARCQRAQRTNLALPPLEQHRERSKVIPIYTNGVLSADGNTAIVGGYYDNTGTGAAWIYTRSTGVWTRQGNKLVGTGAVGNAYGQPGCP
jgi:hypothetical protein